MKLRIAGLIALQIFILNCSDRLINKQDILDLLRDGNENGSSGSSANNNQNTSSDPNATSIQNSQNLDYYGLTNSSTGTNTSGSTGTATGTPIGR
ncbi:MAG: hypothetical protein SH817_04625 [Leptospira sp.]|nr:hypothetical protein [Leptospira sp.]